jgi:hypothetical protein
MSLTGVTKAGSFVSKTGTYIPPSPYCFVLYDSRVDFVSICVFTVYYEGIYESPYYSLVREKAEGDVLYTFRKERAK